MPGTSRRTCPSAAIRAELTVHSSGVSTASPGNEKRRTARGLRRRSARRESARGHARLSS
jgi:hypothetical protein